MARRSFTWRLGGTSPISSRSTVPPSASSSRPLRSWTAPVNEPLEVAEELPLDQAGLGRPGRRQERPARSAAVAVDGPRDQLLAGPALAGDEDRHVGRGDQGDALEQVLHRGRRADERLGIAPPRPRSSSTSVLRLLAVSRARLTTVAAWSRSKGLTR